LIPPYTLSADPPPIRLHSLALPPSPTVVLRLSPLPSPHYLLFPSFFPFLNPDFSRPRFPFFPNHSSSMALLSPTLYSFSPPPFPNPASSTPLARPLSPPFTTHPCSTYTVASPIRPPRPLVSPLLLSSPPSLLLSLHLLQSTLSHTHNTINHFFFSQTRRPCIFPFSRSELVFTGATHPGSLVSFSVYKPLPVYRAPCLHLCPSFPFSPSSLRWKTVISFPSLPYKLNSCFSPQDDLSAF